MKRIALFLMLVVLAMTAGCQLKSKPLPSQITFLHDFETARSQAAQAKLPLIIEFYADTSWCQHCQDFDTLTFADSLIISMANDFIFVRIDAETESALAERFGITGYPTTVIAKSDGAEIDRIEGYMDATEFYNQVHLFLQGKETLEDYLTRLEDEPDNPEYLLTIAGKYLGRTQYRKRHRILPSELSRLILRIDGVTPHDPGREYRWLKRNQRIIKPLSPPARILSQNTQRHGRPMTPAPCSVITRLYQVMKKARWFCIEIICKNTRKAETSGFRNVWPTWRRNNEFRVR